MEPTGLEAIRPDWMFDLSAACQRLAGHTLDGDRATFAAGLASFRADLQEPRTAIEARMLHDRVALTLNRAGEECHKAFHRRTRERRCEASPVARCAAAWSDSAHETLASFDEWVEMYFRLFDAHHSWPPWWQAASHIERCFRESLQLDGMARRVACARSVLMRRFADAFGLSISAYHTRVRVRAGVLELRQSDSKVEAVARLVGYRSPKNFYRALWNLTRLTPSEVRALSSADLDRLLDQALRLVTSHT